MSNFEYKNIDDITKDDFPKRGITLSLDDVSLLQKQLVIPEFDQFAIDEISGDSAYKLELHVFMKNFAYVKSNYDVKTYSTIPGSDHPNLKIQIHKDVKNLGLYSGEYRVVYNLLRNMIGGDSSPNNLFVSNVSADRTELKLSLADPNSIIAKKQLAKFVLENIKPKTFVPPIVLNFGENKVLDVINVTSDGDPTSFFVKLYEPLPADVDTYFVCWVSLRLMKPYIDNVQLIEDSQEQEIAYISGPNFEVDFDYWSTSETNYKSWSDILSENVQTSEQLVNRYISSSGTPVQLNVDFSEFKNFIYYSSARERVDNFIYKAELAEFYRNELTRIATITGSVQTNIVKVQLLKDKLISGFDSFENYLYFNTTGSFNYTYQQSASVLPYPKYEVDVTSSDYHISTKEGKFKFYTSGSVEVTDWAANILTLAEDYDAKNYYALVRALPDHIREDSSNDQAVTFVNMLGQHFDIMFMYTDHLLKKNLREEHPHDGLSQDLIFDVTRNMGWTLAHGTSAKDLWEYALGVSGSTEPIWTGKTTVDRYLSKTYEERTKEVWRRILNNLPYIYKTKGSARSIKALLAAYGIPQTLLNIREFGGPDNADLGIKPRATWDKQTYFLNFHSSYPLPTQTQYVSVPWERINGSTGYQYPDTIEFRWKMEPSSVYAYSNDPVQTILQKNSGSRVDWFITTKRTGSDSEKGDITFYIGDGTTYKSASILDEYLYDNIPLNLMIRRSVKSDLTSSNQIYDFFLKTNKYGNIAVERSASIVVSGSISGDTQRAWVSNGTLYIGSGSNAQTNKILSGSIFELRYWSSILNEDVFDNHVLSARSYNGNSPTSSFYDLQAQFKFWQPFNAAVTSSIVSTHPDQSKSRFEYSNKSSTFVGFTSASFESEYETYNMEVATVGNNTPFTEKVRIDSGSLLSGLSVDQSSEVSAFDTFSVDSNKLMVAFSPQSVMNEDIYEAIGNVSIDDYFGEYSNIDSDDYPRLKAFAREYWKKYSNRNDFTAYIDLISVFDFSIFDQIRQVLPARTNEILGLVIEPNILERSKVKINKGVSATVPSDSILDSNVVSSSFAIPTANISNHKTTIMIGFDDESSYQEIAGEYQIETEVDGIENINISSDVNIVVEPIGSNDHYVTIITGSKATIPQTPTSYKPYKTVVAMGSGSSFIGQYSRYSSTITNKSSGKLATANNALTNPAELDSTFTSTYLRENTSYDGLSDIGVGFGWNTSSNDPDKYLTLVKSIQNYRSDSYYRGYKFFYQTSAQIAERAFTSSSFVTSSVENPTNLPTPTRNNRFEGCKLSGPGVNVDTRNSPDGKAIIEIYYVNPNQINTDKNMDTNAGGNISAI